MSQGAVNSTGTHYWTFTATTSATRLDFSAVQNVNGTASFDNISAKEYTWLDRSGKGNNGKVYGGLAANVAGYWTFDGVDDSIDLPDLGVDYATNVSLEAWVRTSVTSNEWNQIVCGPCGDILWAIHVTGGASEGRLSFGSQCSSPIVHDNESTAIINDGNWYHVMTTYDGANIKHYINGVLDSTFAETNSLVPSGNLRIGSNHVPNGEFMNGDIGEVRVYPRALTAAAVFQNYNATKSKYINEAPDTAPKIGPGIVYDNNLLLNYDFGNRATYDRAENLANNSETFENWTANGSRATITPNQIVAPDGSLTADMIEDFDTSNSYHNLYQYITITAAETYTASLYVKAGTSDWVNFYFDDTNVSFQFSTETISIDPISGNLGGTSGAPPATAGFDNVGNGWYRLYLKDVYASSGSRPFGIWTGANSQTYNPGYIGDPQYNFYIWGAQVETGSTPGRYIKTSGSAITAPTTVKNLSSSSFAGTINGATFNSAGYFDFDGTNDDITTAYTSALDEPQSFTYEVWVNAADVVQSNSFPRIFDKGGNGVLAHITTNAPFSLAFNMNTGSGLRQVQSAINGDQWYHIVMKYDGQIGSIYLNGTGTASTDFGSVVQANTPAAGITLGDTPSSGRELQGSIGEFRYYNRELRAAEISQNFNATRGKYGV